LKSRSSLYLRLGLSPRASSKEITKAYRDLAKLFHPDGSNADESQFQRIQEAYDTLSNPVTRRDYDRGSQNNRTPISWGGGFDGALPRFTGTVVSDLSPPTASVKQTVSSGIENQERGNSIPNGVFRLYEEVDSPPKHDFKYSGDTD